MMSLLLFLIMCAIFLRWLFGILTRNPELGLRLLGRAQAFFTK